jgi:hypothetical protein
MPSGVRKLDLVGSAQAEVVGDEGLDEGAGAPRGIKDQGAGGLDLAHGELPPVTVQALAGTQRGGDERHPAVEEGLDLLRAEAIADHLKAGRVAAGGEAVGEFDEGETFGAGLTLGPFGGP